MIAAIRNPDGDLLAVHRTWIDDGRVITRKIMGYPRNGFVDLGGAGPTLLVGEGIETVGSFRGIFAHTRLHALLTASRLSTFEPPSWAKLLLIAVDRDAAGLAAAMRLRETAEMRGIDTRSLIPLSDFTGADFNDDLRRFGFNTMAEHVRRQVGASTKE